MNVQKQTYFSFIGVNTIAAGANRGFGNSLINLNTLMESLVADGKVSKVFNLRFHIRALGQTAECSFALIPLIVQTNGTFTDTVNLSNREISAVLDQCIDDEFGLQKIGDFRVSKVIPIADDAAGGGVKRLFGSEFTVQVPRNIVNLLNKETSTERLQSLHFAIVGSTNPTQSISVETFYEVTFVEKTKGITIR